MSNPPMPSTENRSDTVWKLLLVAILAGAMAALVLRHTIGINGSGFFLWEYRRIGWWRIYPAMLLAAIPFLFSQTLLSRSPVKAIIAMMISTLAMQIVMAGLAEDPYDLLRIAKIIQSPMSTSYFVDAGMLHGQQSLAHILGIYDSLLQHLTFHSSEKPPGPILFHMIFIHFFGDQGWGALLCGLAIGVLSIFSVPAIYLFTRLITANTRASLIAAAYFSLSPCLVLIFPAFDGMYPIFTCAMLGFWILGMRDNRYWASAAFGGVLSLSVFFSYCHLVLGAFVVIYALTRVREHGRGALKQFIVHSVIGLGTVMGIYGILWLATGFNPIATFHQALLNQEELLKSLMIPRHWPQTIPADLQDYLLGSAWISLPLILFWLLKPDSARSTVQTVGVGLAQILIVALTGLMPGETARVWMFLQPLAMIPVGLEVARWGTWYRMSLWGILWLLTVVIGQNMAFIQI